jgi:hypothetical protein
MLVFQLPQTPHATAAAVAAAAAAAQRNALSYFNFMNDEGRSVVGALLPAGVGAAPGDSSTDSSNP